MTNTPRERGDVLVRGLQRDSDLWTRFMRELRRLQVDRPETTVRSVLAPLIERWLEEKEGKP